MIRCTDCEAPLAHDQRYCLDCGARRGPLPDTVAAMLAASDPLATAPAAPPPRPAGAWIPSPRVAAVAVMGMLAFGAELGAIVGASGVATLAAAPLLVVRQNPAPPRIVTVTAPVADTASSASGGSSASSGGGGSTPAGGGGGSAPPVAAPPSTTAAATSPSTATSPTAPANPYGLPPITHVFVIMLGPEGYSQTFGSPDPYLSQTLPRQGKLIQWYYGVAGSELANQIALISGQGPTPQTVADCPTYANIAPGSPGRHGQVLGDGCVYPKATNTLGGQMTAARLTWKAYLQGMSTATPGQPQACRHPAPGSADPNQAPQSGDTYVTWRNPFVYFHSVIDSQTCSHLDVDFTQLSTDLTNVSTTPNLSYIVANPCDDGNVQPCVTGGASGVAAADSFLKLVVPEIENSAAYQAGGLIAITFDQAPQTGPYADPSACCATPTYPNLTGTPATPAPVTTTTSSTTTSTSTTTTSTTTTSATTTVPPASLGPGQGQTSPTGGGGQVGLLLISKWIKPGTRDLIDYYNHFSLLASIEDIFNLKHLGYAGQTGLAPLDAGTFDGNGPSGG